ncbi:MAG: PQQ-binding-like beta-propeller repeat protein, partial [Rhodothermales bacterium]
MVWPASAQQPDDASWTGFRNGEARTGRASGPGPDRPARAWTFTLDGVGYASAAVDEEGTVYTGSSGSLYAIDSNGQRKWSVPSDGYAISSPSLGNGSVYFGSSDHSLYAIDTASGSIE